MKTPPELPDRTDCGWCGEELGEEELENPYLDNGGDLMCNECHWTEYGRACGICCNKYDTRHWTGTHFAVFEEVDGFPDSIMPGIYRVNANPFYTQPLIGAGSLHGNNISRHSDLPGGATGNGYPCEFLCQECTDKLPPGNTACSGS